MKLTYCSFADEERCRGIVILEGHLNPLEAALVATMLGINPHGELVAIEVPEDLEDIDVYIANRNRLISVEQARVLFDAVTLREWEAELN